MSVGNQIAVAAIQSVDIQKSLHLLPRIVAEIERTNAAMPNATGADKRARVLADLKIIFDDVNQDLILPAAASVLNLLIEIGVNYVKSKVA